MGHRRQQASGARPCLAPGRHDRLARLPPGRELLEARETGAPAHLCAHGAGRKERSNDRTGQAVARGRERGAHGAPITRGAASRIPADVRRAGEPAPCGGAPPVTACDSSVAGSRHCGGHRSVVSRSAPIGSAPPRGRGRESVSGQGRGTAPSRQPARAGAAFRLVGIVEDTCGCLTGAGPQLAVGAGVSDSWSVVFERVLRRMLVVVACVLGVGPWSACGAADARAAQLSVHAVPGGRVSVRLRGPVGSGAHDFRLDGKRLSRTRRRAITVVVARRRAAADPLARWRVLTVRRAGSRRVLARARFALGVSRSRAAPTLVLLKAPPPRTTSTRAVLRFSVSSRTASCGSRRLALATVLEPDRLQRSLLRLAPLQHPGRQPTRNHEDPSRLDGPRPLLGHTAPAPLLRLRHRPGVEITSSRRSAITRPVRATRTTSRSRTP